MTASVLAFFAVLISGCAVWLMVSIADARTQERLVAQQTLEADLWARMLNARMEAHQRLLASIAEGMHSSLLDKPAVLDALMQQDGSMLRLFESLHVALPSGAVTHHGAVGAVAEINSIGMGSLRRTLVEGKPSVTFLNVLDDLQHLSVLLSVPMRQTDGHVAGALAAKVKLPIAALMPEMRQVKSNVGYALLDSDGTVLAHSDMAQQTLHADTLFAEYRTQWQALSKPSTANADTQVWGQMLVSRVGMPLPQWQVVILRDMSQDAVWAGGIPLRIVLLWLGAMLVLVLLASMTLERIAKLRSGQASQDSPQSNQDLAEAAVPAPQAEKPACLDAVWESIPVPMLVEQGGQIGAMTPQARAILGYCCDEMPALRMEQLVEASDKLMVARQSLISLGRFEGMLSLRKKDGDPVWIQATAWAYGETRDATVWRLQLPWQPQSCTPLPDKEHAWRDSLTELPNRDAFMWGLQSWVADSMQMRKEGPGPNRTMPTCGCILFVDLDHLGMMNEVISREMGNQLLRHVGRLMADYTQPLGPMARLGGDEFAALLPGISLAHAQGIAQALCDAVWRWQPHWAGERQWVSISIGVVAVDALRHTPQQALRAADMACYEAKRRGRCQVAVGQICAQTVLPD